MFQAPSRHFDPHLALPGVCFACAAHEAAFAVAPCENCV